jgi:hypothetical protein
MTKFSLIVILIMFKKSKFTNSYIIIFVKKCFMVIGDVMKLKKSYFGETFIF